MVVLGKLTTVKWDPVVLNGQNGQKRNQSKKKTCLHPTCSHAQEQF